MTYTAGQGVAVPITLRPNWSQPLLMAMASSPVLMSQLEIRTSRLLSGSMPSVFGAIAFQPVPMLPTGARMVRSVALQASHKSSAIAKEHELDEEDIDHCSSVYHARKHLDLPGMLFISDITTRKDVKWRDVMMRHLIPELYTKWRVQKGEFLSVVLRTATSVQERNWTRRGLVWEMCPP